eukprot:1750390-Amphidinium_carterae.1
MKSTAIFSGTLKLQHSTCGPKRSDMSASQERLVTRSLGIISIWTGSPTCLPLRVKTRSEVQSRVNPGRTA